MFIKLNIRKKFSNNLINKKIGVFIRLNTKKKF